MPRLPLAALAVSLALAGCDFTPTLDVAVPDFAPALTVNGVLAADSTVEVRVTAATDPYQDQERQSMFVVPDGTTAELFQDGASVGPLRLESERCPDWSAYAGSDEPFPTFECGAFVSGAVVRPGATYTLRVAAPGYPPAEATVTVPDRVAVAVESDPPTVREFGSLTTVSHSLRVSFRDPPGEGDRYALLAVSGPYRYTDRYSVCRDPACQDRVDTTVVVSRNRAPMSYTTTDPVLLAGARTLPSNGTPFITFTDEAFDGTRRTFPILSGSVRSETDGAVNRELAAVWVVAVDAATFGAYQIAWFGNPTGDDFNPFAEPADLPSNVAGGYGLLGAVTINEALVE